MRALAGIMYHEQLCYLLRKHARGMIWLKRQLLVGGFRVSDNPSPDALLAAILTSKKIGLIHTRRVGEVLIASARLNEWLLCKGKKCLSADRWVDMIERIIESDERYEEIWLRLDSSTSTVPRIELQDLEIALQDAALLYDSIRDEFESEYGAVPNSE